MDTHERIPTYQEWNAFLDRFDEAVDDYFSDEETSNEDEAYAALAKRDPLPAWRPFCTTHLLWPSLPAKTKSRDCPICRLSFQNDDTRPLELPCQFGHQICLECAREWFKPHPEVGGPQQNNACPMCREKLFRHNHEVVLPEELPRDNSLQQDEDPQDSVDGELPDVHTMIAINAETLDESIVWVTEAEDAAAGFVRLFRDAAEAFESENYEPPQYWSSTSELRTPLETHDQNILALEITAEEALLGAQMLFYSLVDSYMEGMRVHDQTGKRDMMTHPATVYAVLMLVEYFHKYATSSRPLRQTLLTLERRLDTRLKFSPLAEQSDKLPAFWRNAIGELIEAAVSILYQERCRTLRNDRIEDMRETSHEFEGAWQQLESGERDEPIIRDARDSWLWLDKNFHVWVAEDEVNSPEKVAARFLQAMMARLDTMNETPDDSTKACVAWIGKSGERCAISGTVQELRSMNKCLEEQRRRWREQVKEVDDELKGAFEINECPPGQACDGLCRATTPHLEAMMSKLELDDAN